MRFGDKKQKERKEKLEKKRGMKLGKHPQFESKAMKSFLDKKAKMLEKKKKKQSAPYKNNPAFGDDSHHSNKKTRMEHHQKDANGNPVDHGDGTPSNVEEGAPYTVNYADKLGNTPAYRGLMSGKKNAVTGKPLYKAGVLNKAHYEPEGEIIDEADKKGKGSGKKDACYHKVKAASDVWPSAYASGRLVQCRKVGAANYGKSKSKKESYEFQIPMKSFDQIVGECWKTHERVPGTVKGAKGSCRPKGSGRTKNEEFVGEEGINKDPSFDIMRPGGKNSPYNKDGTPKVNPNNFKLPGEKGRIEYLKTLNMGEAVKSPKLDIKETGVKNKIEINPEIKTEAAKAPVKK